uniref:Uncharacterized protein n=1 Tax=Anguilla anguilla TaxID=7936 RepID=A0A0E9PKF2_ANGAN
MKFWHLATKNKLHSKTASHTHAYCAHLPTCNAHVHTHKHTHACKWTYGNQDSFPAAGSKDRLWLLKTPPLLSMGVL